MIHFPLMFLSEWREFPSAPCLAEKKNLTTARVSMLKKPRASPDMLPVSLCNKKRLAIRHTNRPFFPTTLTIPTYDIGLRTYQRDLVVSQHAMRMRCAAFSSVSYSAVQYFSTFSHKLHDLKKKVI